MKKSLLLVFVSVLFLYFLVGHLSDWQQLASLILNANWWFLWIAIVLEIVRYYYFATLYKEAFSIYGVRWSMRQLLPLVLASVSLSLAAPLGPMAGATVFVGQAKDKEMSLFSTVAGIFVVMLSDFLALLGLLTLSVAFLSFQHQLKHYEFVGYIIFAGLALGLFSTFVLAAKNPKILRGLLRLSQGIVNKFSSVVRKNDILSKDWADKKTQEFNAMSSKLIEQRRVFGKLIRIAIYTRLFDMATVFFLFLSFGQLISVVPLLIGYSLGMLFWIVSPTPQGVGVVESVMPVAFGSLGVDVGVATLVTLAFRGLALWIPALVGFIVLRKLVKNTPTTTN